MIWRVGDASPHAAPVVAIQVWVRVGSADERPDEAGLAHLHEHMLFKGTGRRGPGGDSRGRRGMRRRDQRLTSFDLSGSLRTAPAPAHGELEGPRRRRLEGRGRPAQLARLLDGLGSRSVSHHESRTRSRDCTSAGRREDPSRVKPRTLASVPITGFP